MQAPLAQADRRRAYLKAWHLAHPDYRRQWNEANREKGRAYKRKAYAAKREKLRKRQAVYNAAHREECASRTREWYARNKEKARANARQYHASHREAHRAYVKATRDQANATYRAWTAANPETVTAIQQRRRARKLAAPGTGVSKYDWRDILHQYGGRCAYCGKLAKLTQDHIEPLSQGGAHDVNNVAPACQSCNSAKHNHSLVAWLIRRRAA